MIIDSHIHFGQFYNLHISPQDIVRLMNDVAVNYYAISSTSICEENYAKVKNEFDQLLTLDKSRALPIMWITPFGLDGNIAWFLESDIKWKGIKIHPLLHPKEWNPDNSKMREVLSIAEELCLPLIIHTGEEECCSAGRFIPSILKHPNIKWILAHGRPTTETIALLKRFPNVYADSAFMPVDVMCRIISSGLSNKLLWGTDMCIPQYYYSNINLIDYYNNKIGKFRESCGKIEYELVTYYNAATLFGL